MVRHGAKFVDASRPLKERGAFQASEIPDELWQALENFAKEPEEADRIRDVGNAAWVRMEPDECEAFIASKPVVRTLEGAEGAEQLVPA